MASGLLLKTSHQSTGNKSQSDSEDTDKEEDSVYVKSYSNYSIHLEMLQVWTLFDVIFIMIITKLNKIWILKGQDPHWWLHERHTGQ